MQRIENNCNIPQTLAYIPLAVMVNPQITCWEVALWHAKSELR